MHPGLLREYHPDNTLGIRVSSIERCIVEADVSAMASCDAKGGKTTPIIEIKRSNEERRRN